MPHPLPAGKDPPPVCIALEAEWAQELVSAVWQREKISCSESQIFQHLAYNHYTE